MTSKKRVPDPTPQEIAERSAEVQRQWSEQERANRRCSQPNRDALRIDALERDCDQPATG